MQVYISTYLQPPLIACFLLQALFALASCSKAFLVTSIGLLMDDYAHGRNVTPLPHVVDAFDWDTKMQELLPDEWALQDEWATAKANLRDAFGHVTGLPRSALPLPGS